jgi:DNA-binding transcriptional LysR family regulator
LNFTHAADRLHVSQPPFSKQIHDLEGELGIDLFARQRKGVALSPAGKSFLVDARRILEDCEASVRKAQRISRGEIGELAIGYMSALTHEFLGKSTRGLAAHCAGHCRRLHRDGLSITGAGAA